MSSPVHHEFGERRLRYGPKGMRAYARKPYCDAWGNMVPALFPDEEGMGSWSSRTPTSGRRPGQLSIGSCTRVMGPSSFHLEFK
ncbi:hypothetical protein YC2023_065852 [Brassica napus]